VNTLIRVLKHFKGSYIVVSHDRFFLAEVANKIWYIEDHQLKEYPGTYAEYDEWVRLRSIESQKPVNKTKESKKKNNEGSKSQKENKKVKKLKTMVRNLEDQISDTEKKMQELIAMMSDENNSSDFNKLSKLQNDHDQLETKASQLQKDWDSAYNELLETEKKE